MRSPIIRRATPDDVELLTALIRRTVIASNTRHYETEAIGRLLEAMAPERVAERMATRECFLACENGELVGTGSLGEERLRQMFVAPERQRSGLGRRPSRACRSARARARRCRAEAFLLANCAGLLRAAGLQGGQVPTARRTDLGNGKAPLTAREQAARCRSGLIPRHTVGSGDNVSATRWGQMAIVVCLGGRD